MSTITVAIVITEGFSTFHVSVPLILFGGDTGREGPLQPPGMCGRARAYLVC